MHKSYTTRSFGRALVARAALCVLVLFVGMFFAGLFSTVLARETAPLGMHIMNTHELAAAKEMLVIDEDNTDWHYITVPFTNGDVDEPERWQQFFNDARELRVIPLVRLVTEVADAAWIVPTQKDVVRQISVLSALEWPTSKRHIIVFNEVNHAKEWGNTIDPAEYARTLRFTSSWARSENKNYVVLPAAMDLAAPNGAVTMEAFAYLRAMAEFEPEIFTYIDAWNSHAYPNPAFSAPPYQTGQNSLSGFMQELEFLRSYTDKEYRVYITETGWEDSARIQRFLPGYYLYALQHVWSHPQVEAVTPFVLRGAPGPFAGFSFLGADNQLTPQAHALRGALQDFEGAR